MMKVESVQSLWTTWYQYAKKQGLDVGKYNIELHIEGDALKDPTRYSIGLNCRTASLTTGMICPWMELQQIAKPDTTLLTVRVRADRSDWPPSQEDYAQTMAMIRAGWNNKAPTCKCHCWKGLDVNPAPAKRARHSGA